MMNRQDSGSALLGVLTMGLIIGLMVMILGTVVTTQQRLVRHTHDRSIYEAEVERVAHLAISQLGLELAANGTVESWGEPTGSDAFFALTESEMHSEVGWIRSGAHQLDSGLLHLETQGRAYTVRFDPEWAKVITLQQVTGEDHDPHNTANFTLTLGASSNTGDTYALTVNSKEPGFLHAIVDNPLPGLVSSTTVLTNQAVTNGANTVIFADPHPGENSRLRLLYSREPATHNGPLRWLHNGEPRGVSSVTHATLTNTGATTLELEPPALPEPTPAE